MCGDPRAPSVQIVLRVRPLGPTPWRAVCSLVWSFADQTWSQGRLRCPRAIPLEMPLLSTVITRVSLFTWVPLGIFPHAVSEQIQQPLLGLQSFAWFFFASYFPPYILSFPFFLHPPSFLSIFCSGLRRKAWGGQRGTPPRWALRALPMLRVKICVCAKLLQSRPTL